MRDFALGEHLLLVGNQGVGKNKIVDRLLQLMHCPREYIQLHRDTTVQTLTLQPQVESAKKLIKPQKGKGLQMKETGRATRQRAHMLEQPQVERFCSREKLKAKNKIWQTQKC